jgi:L-ribulokinase
MGTSFVHLLMWNERRIVEGICGVVEDGIVPGFWGYEAGQYAGGDMFAWFFDHGVPASVKSRARKLNIPFTALLEKQAAALRPGESGLLALDWWNGNRCVLVDADLTGLLLGATLATPSEAIFRALMEATAFGTRQIVEAFEAKGLHTKDIVTCGGLPAKNKLLMQIFADVIGREIKVAKRPQTCSALGAAIHAAAAAGREVGGYKTISEAAEHMAHLQGLTYRPRPANHEIYSRLFKEFQTLHDYFGRGENDVMKRLKALRRKQAVAH